MVRRRSNKTNRRTRSKTSIRKTRKTRRVKSKKRSKKLHGGANAHDLKVEVLKEDKAKKYIKTLLTTKSRFLEIPIHTVSKVYEEKGDIIVEEILDILNKNKEKYSYNNLYEATVSYILSNK